MLRLYYYPPLHGSHYGNPYSDNFRAELSKYFRIVNRPSRWYAGMSGSLFLSAFRADVYVLNWVENIRFFAYGLWQYRLLRLVLWVLRMRGARIVW